jgi:hypothetical protein
MRRDHNLAVASRRVTLLMEVGGVDGTRARSPWLTAMAAYLRTLGAPRTER